MGSVSPRCLVLGLGAVGTYIGAQIAATGMPVTFLVRSGKADIATGACIKVTCPDRTFDVTNIEITDNVEGPFDIVVLACKTFQLVGAIEAVEPVVADSTVLLPLLNGTTHLSHLDKVFSPAQVWGGLAHFSVIKQSPTHVERLSSNDILVAGPRNNSKNHNLTKLFEGIAGGGMAARISTNILYEMWEKWVFIVTLAGMTGLMRGASGEIASQLGGKELVEKLFNEAVSIAAAAGYNPTAEFVAQSLSLLTNVKLSYKASLLRDIESGNRTEVDGLMVEFIKHGELHGIKCPYLELATLHITIHEARVASDT